MLNNSLMDGLLLHALQNSDVTHLQEARDNKGKIIIIIIMFPKH